MKPQDVEVGKTYEVRTVDDTTVFNVRIIEVRKGGFVAEWSDMSVIFLSKDILNIKQI